VPATEEWFTEQAKNTGLDFVHSNGRSGKFYPPEIMAPGVALLDYDNDGDLDVFVVQGQPLEGKSGMPATRGRLFRNDLTVQADGQRVLKFTDVTAQSGIVTAGFGMGVATGDFDNDGCVDLYVTEYGRNQLFHSNCNGTFTDITAKSGTASPGWSSSAAFVDYDRDGWLDLFVGHYLRFAVSRNKACRSWAGEPDYCAPSAYEAEQSRLYHNNHDGTFTDVTSAALGGVVIDAAGERGDYGPALGVATADFNRDGWIDIYVANDGQPNQLWINQHDGTFINTALLGGAAIREDSGRPTASMGVDAGDFDNDGDDDIVIANFTAEGDSLFVNRGDGTFEDRSDQSRLSPLSLKFTGFGAAWFDFDNDGWLDLLTVNGTVRMLEGQSRTKDAFPFAQTKQLFRNLNKGRTFEDVTAQAGPAFQLSEVGRGAAFGDIDNDGDTDIVVANDEGPLRLFINNIGNRKHWLGLRLVDRGAKRDFVGARVGVSRKDAPAIYRRARADGSYASANDPRVLVGLGDSIDAPHVKVTWPDGSQEEWSGLPVDRYTTLTAHSTAR
jgi:hypothetical protein